MSDLIVRDVCKIYPNPSQDVVVLDHLNLELNRGENLAIMGPSGAGKSTLLQILGALDTPSSGTIELGGKNPFALNEKEQARFRNEQIGFVFQDHHLLPQWNVLENTLLPALAFGKPTAEHHVRAAQLLDRVGLKDRINHLPNQLSGGERERVAVARALLLKPTLVLADEPTGNLDSDNAKIVGELLLEVPKEQDAILIVVTHSRELAQRMSRCLELRRGKLQPFTA
ncbi:MAG: ABC transporter ATP-binding protein [Planctomycetes bacterium]|nr:ABC transporter ATP-binding protein [Planctomycetota bacterium]